MRQLKTEYVNRNPALTMMKIIFFTALLILLPLPLIIFAALCNRTEIRNRGTGPMIKDIARATVSAGISLIIAICTRPFTFLSNLPLIKKNGDDTPILMTHGLYHNKVAWVAMRYRLNLAGYTNLHTWQYNSFTTSYPELVLELRDIISKLHLESGREIILTGHSLGGLLSCGAAQDPEIEKMCAGIITLGTPYRGSILATIALGRLGRSLHPQGSLFKGKNKIGYPRNIPKTAIISPTDELVLPWSNLEPTSEEWQLKRTHAMGHVAMLYSRQVGKMVVESIRKIQNQ
ncbi:esterase/lipase family protein [Maridesulfovibrio salexigens]|uniref:PGAP1 family protein n=1 Tax=Maridesulfovibrio salexigens (strain ATCC 14822 / DSM 2638 / NCIMB 8403 / VKM B-1763) TaxID=526222 RepID=C6BS01_MARSD|nr:PGAP1 family protein [Maridesulfovibrio salexigens]ACS81384.1 PGAP1 family protein [Maridesulfovibrio salexigens DSM 2638]